jgi:hypothetical protein
MGRGLTASEASDRGRRIGCRGSAVSRRRQSGKNRGSPRDSLDRIVRKRAWDRGHPARMRASGPCFRSHGLAGGTPECGQDARGPRLHTHLKFAPASAGRSLLAGLRRERVDVGSRQDLRRAPGRLGVDGGAVTFAPGERPHPSPPASGADGARVGPFAALTSSRGLRRGPRSASCRGRRRGAAGRKREPWRRRPRRAPLGRRRAGC